MTPTSAPTGAPTVSPTGAPTGAPTSATVTGDPHVTNVEGERFNLNRVGVHELLRLPRRSGSFPGRARASRGSRRAPGDPQASGSEALLEVLGTVEAERSCAEPFVKQLDLSGLWLQESGPLVLRAGGLGTDSMDAIVLQVNGSHIGKDELTRDSRLQGLLQAAEPKAKHGKRDGATIRRDTFFTIKLRFSGATLTVDWVHREVPGSSLNHLDLHVAGLPKLGRGMDVGGVLGRDDHAAAASFSPGCEPNQELIFRGRSFDVPGSLLGASHER